MGSVDFTDWVAPDLELTLGGTIYTVAPPSVDQARLILALTVRSEIALGLTQMSVPDELAKILEGHAGVPLGQITLAGAYDKLIKDNHPAVTIERMAFYAMHYWSRGKDRADAIAKAMWEVTHKPDGDDASGEANSR